MKRIIPFLLILATLSSCTVYHYHSGATGGNDDVYYRPSDDVAAVEPAIETDDSYSAPAPSTGSYDYIDGETRNEDGNQYVTNNYYQDNSYSARFRRWYGPSVGVSYFSTCYDPFFYDPWYNDFGFNNGWNVSIGFGQPFYRYRGWNNFYRPRYAFYNPWGFNSWGYNSWNYGGFYRNGFDPYCYGGGNFYGNGGYYYNYGNRNGRYNRGQKNYAPRNTAGSNNTVSGRGTRPNGGSIGGGKRDANSRTMGGGVSISNNSGHATQVPVSSQNGRGDVRATSTSGKVVAPTNGAKATSRGNRAGNVSSTNRGTTIINNANVKVSSTERVGSRSNSTITKPRGNSMSRGGRNTTPSRINQQRSTAPKTNSPVRISRPAQRSQPTRMSTPKRSTQPTQIRKSSSPSRSTVQPRQFSRPSAPSRNSGGSFRSSGGSSRPSGGSRSIGRSSGSRGGSSVGGRSSGRR